MKRSLFFWNINGSLRVANGRKFFLTFVYKDMPKTKSNPKTQ
jgi:hypothetical protein